MKNGLTEEEMKRMEALGVQFFNSPEEQELAYLREGIKRTPEQRYLFLMMLMREGRMMQRAIRVK